MFFRDTIQPLLFGSPSGRRGTRVRWWWGVRIWTGAMRFLSRRAAISWSWSRPSSLVTVTCDIWFAVRFSLHYDEQDDWPKRALRGFATGLLHPTLIEFPIHSDPSSSFTARSASFRSIYETNPVRPRRALAWLNTSSPRATKNVNPWHIKAETLETHATWFWQSRPVLALQNAYRESLLKSLEANLTAHKLDIFAFAASSWTYNEQIGALLQN